MKASVTKAPRSVFVSAFIWPLLFSNQEQLLSVKDWSQI